MKINVLFLLFLFLCPFLFGQKIKAEFSESKKLKFKKEGTLTQFIGGNDEYIYSIYKCPKPSRSNKRSYFVATDKKTLTEKIRIPLTGKGTSRSKALSDLTFIKSFSNQNGILNIWKKNEKGSEFYFTEYLDEKLNRVGDLKEIFNSSKVIKNKNEAEFIGLEIIQDKNKTDEYCLVYELSFGKNNPIKMGYVAFDSDMKKLNSGQVPLQVIQGDKTKPNKLTGSYYFSNDGFIFTKHMVLVNDERTKKFWKAGKSKMVLNRVNPELEEVMELNIEHPEMSISDASIASNDKSSVIFGVFKDPNLIDNSNISHGTFVVDFNERSKEIEDFKLSYFTKEQLDRIYHRSEASKKEKRKLDKKAAKTGGETDGKLKQIEGELIFEYSELTDNNELIIIGSFMSNYSVETCTTTGNSTTCTSRYYCQKTDVDIFKLSANGEIEFAEVIDRSTVYDGFDKMDVNVLKKDGRLYLFYGNKLSVESSGKSKAEIKAQIKKEKKEGISTQYYTVYDQVNDKAKIESYQFNQISNRKRDTRQLNNLNVTQIGNELYSFNTIKTLNPIKTPIAVVSSLLIVPGIYVMLNPQVIADFHGTMMKISAN